MNPKAALDDMRTIKRLLTDAERIARELGVEEPGAEHLLLAAVELPDGTAARVLAAVGVHEGDVRRALLAEEVDALTAVGVPRDRAEALASPIPLGPGDRPILYAAGPSAREAFQAAGARARAARQRLTGAHVVAAVAAMERGAAAAALKRLGVDRAELEMAATRAATDAVAGRLPGAS